MTFPKLCCFAAVPAVAVIAFWLNAQPSQQAVSGTQQVDVLEESSLPETPNGSGDAAATKSRPETYPAKPSIEQITRIPELLEKGQNGYVIFIGSELKARLQNFDDFINHKEALGFRVSVVTEQEWGGGKSNDAVRNIRKWLVDHYQKDKLLYALLIGNPHMSEGNIPMASTPSAWTDWPYMDLDCDWSPLLDKEAGLRKKDMKNGTIDMSKINGRWEVLVGRIPWYGPESSHWKAEDVDAVLARTIRYENDTGDRSWRFNHIWSEHGDGSKKTLRFRSQRSLDLRFDLASKNAEMPVFWLHGRFPFATESLVFY